MIYIPVSYTQLDVYKRQGYITCCDPLVTLPSNPDTYLRQVTPGTYLLETKIIEMEPNEYRYVASRVVFSGNEPVYYLSLIHI